MDIQKRNRYKKAIIEIIQDLDKENVTARATKLRRHKPAYENALR